MIKKFILYKEKPFKTDSELVVSFLGPPQMKYIATKDIPVMKLLAELADGNKCLALIKDGAVLSYLWINERYIEYFGLKTKLSKNDCYLYSASTRPDLRGKGYAGILRAKAYEILKKDNYFSVTDVKNKSAIRFKEKINAQEIAKYTYVKFWKFEKLYEVSR